MAEELDDGEFWLPSHFLTEEDILMDFKVIPELTPSGSSTSLTSDTTASTTPIDDSSSGKSSGAGGGFNKSESEDDDEFYTALTNQVCDTFFAEDFSSSDSPKGSDSPTSPQSTLRPVSVHSETGSNDTWGSTRNSPTAPVSPPPTTTTPPLPDLATDESGLEALNVALKEMARLSLVSQQYQQYGGTGFFDSSRGAIPSPTPTNFENRYSTTTTAPPIYGGQSPGMKKSGRVAPRPSPFLGVSISDGKEHLRELVQLQNSLQNQIRGQLQAIEIMKFERRQSELNRSKPLDRRPYFHPPANHNNRIPKSGGIGGGISSEDSLTDSSSRPPLGLPPSAWPPLQQNLNTNNTQPQPQLQQQPQQVERSPHHSRTSSVPRTQAAVGAAVVYPKQQQPPPPPLPVWMRESVGGTGVFIPKRPVPASPNRGGGVVNQNQPPRRNVGGQKITVGGSIAGPRAQRSVQSPNISSNFEYNNNLAVAAAASDCSVDAGVVENNNGCAGFGFRRIVNNSSSGNSHGLGEIQLPAEWSY